MCRPSQTPKLKMFKTKVRRGSLCARGLPTAGLRLCADRQKTLVRLGRPHAHRFGAPVLSKFETSTHAPTQKRRRAVHPFFIS